MNINDMENPAGSESDDAAKQYLDNLPKPEPAQPQNPDPAEPGKNKETNRCAHCKKPASAGLKTCESCRERSRKYMQKKRESAKEEGRKECDDCHVETSGDYYCEKCKKKRNAKEMERRLAVEADKAERELANLSELKPGEWTFVAEDPGKEYSK